jgi:pyruvate/2-oxoglutarate dehydrogenase complex dihydrolipoamide acyltransferase (E2) component
MPIQIVMPTLSPTMDKGKLAKWRVKEGQQVKPGDVICEVETDKATIEVEAVDSGRVAKLLVAEGTADVKVNTPIAFLESEGSASRVAGALTQRVGLVRPHSGAKSETGTPQPHPDVVPTARREAQNSGGGTPAGTVIGRARLKGDHGQPESGGGLGTVAPTVGSANGRTRWVIASGSKKTLASVKTRTLPRAREAARFMAVALPRRSGSLRSTTRPRPASPARWSVASVEPSETTSTSSRSAG